MALVLPLFNQMQHCVLLEDSVLFVLLCDGTSVFAKSLIFLVFASLLLTVVGMLALVCLAWNSVIYTSDGKRWVRISVSHLHLLSATNARPFPQIWREPQRWETTTKPLFCHDEVQSSASYFFIPFCLWDKCKYMYSPSPPLSLFLCSKLLLYKVWSN